MLIFTKVMMMKRNFGIISEEFDVIDIYNDGNCAQKLISKLYIF